MPISVYAILAFVINVIIVKYITEQRHFYHEFYILNPGYKHANFLHKHSFFKDYTILPTAYLNYKQYIYQFKPNIYNRIFD
jgi:hypothetical protein